MKKYNLAIFFISLFFISSTTNTSHSQNGWFNQYSTNLDRNANSIFFINSQTGWVVQDSNIVYKTTNAGLTWVIYELPYKCQLEAIHFTDENTGWACGNKYTPIPFFDTGVIYRTTNGGVNWIYGTAGGMNYTDVCFANANTGFATVSSPQPLESRGWVSMTTNAGANWENAFSEYYTFAFGEVQFVNQTTGYVLGRYTTDFPADTTLILKTENSGQSWTKIFQEPRGTGSFTPVTFYAYQNNIWVLVYGKLYYSTNRGANWQNITMSNLIVYNNMFFVNQNTGWIAKATLGGSDTLNLLKTINGGLNWSGYKNPLGNLNDIFFVNEYTGWATTSGYQINVNILKSVTGGIMRLENISQILVSNYRLHQNYPNPFNPTTKIRFQVASSGHNPNIQLNVYDINGKLISELFNGKLSDGVYEIDWNAGNLPSGTYFYSLISEDFKEVRKMILMK